MIKHIETRGWDKGKSEWVWRGEEIFALVPELTEIRDGVRNRKDIIITQSTGLKDVKGMKIFEGDVVQIGGALYLIGWDGKELEWGLFTLSARNPNVSEHQRIENYYFAGGGMAVFWTDTQATGSVEVVGNIFDNPSYLKPTEEKE